MEMIIGGAFQGKSAYAKEKYPNICWKNGGEISKEELMTAGGVLDFQDFIKKELKSGEDVSAHAQELARRWAMELCRWMPLTGNTGKLSEECAPVLQQKAAELFV